MNFFRILILAVFTLFFGACGDDKSYIASFTSGVVDTNITLQVVFKDEVTKNTNNIFESSGEIKINGKNYFGKYMFNQNNSLILLPDSTFNANENYKIEFDFKAINEITQSNIQTKKFNMEFKTSELIIETPRANFIKDKNDLSKINLDATFEISQEIPFESIKENVKLLDSNNKAVEIDIIAFGAKKFNIISTPLPSPQNSDETYTLIFEKKIGVSKDIKIPITAIKIVNLDIIDIKTNNKNIEVRFSSPLAMNLNLNNFIKITPSIDFSASLAGDTINIKAPFKESQTYKIEILKGIVSRPPSNLKLEESYSKEVQFYDKEPKIVFSNNGVFLPDSNNKKIAFKSINVKKARVVVKKIYTNNITQFVHNSDFFKNSMRDYYLYDFNIMGDVIEESEIKIDSQKNVWVQNEIDLSGIKDLSGIFIVSLHFSEDDVDYTFPSGTAEWKKRNYFYDNGNIYRQLIFSNMALIAQKYGDNIIVSSLDIRTNKPLSDIIVESISANNQVISSGISNKNGDTILKYKGSGDLEHLETFYITARSEDFKNFAILKQNQRVNEDGFDIDGISPKNGIKAFIYTDRGVYRPGDSVNLNIIARNGEAALTHPIKLTIINPRNKKQVDGLNIESSSDGMYYYEFKTPKNADTGIYNAIIDIGDNVFTHKIAIESVVPNRIKTQINVEDMINITKEQNINFSLQSDYLFGAPASELEYKVEANITPKIFNSKKYKDYTFDNPTNLRYTSNKSLSGTLNENGFSQRSIKLDSINDINKNLEANIIAWVYENSGRAVSARKKIYLKKFDSFVGIKKPITNYIKQNENITIPVILLDENENSIPNRKLKYRIYNNSYSWWWDYDNYNQFLRSIKADKNTRLIKEGEIISKNEISHIMFQVKERGEILLEVEDSTNKQSASILLYSSSWGEPLDVDKITQLKIKANKDSYIHNENAKVSFESVKGGRALITISNNSEIVDRYWIDTDEIQSQVEVKIDEKYAPNLYVSVFMLQNYESLDNDRALRLYGVVPLKITNQNSKINLEINAKDKIEPNSDLSIEISNKENKQVTYTLAIVDEGLINLTDFKTPNPWNYFYAKTRLGIESFDTYDYIINKTSGSVNKVYAIGGDEEFEQSNKQKDDSADRFKPVVFFTPPTKSDEKGYAKLNFKIPSYFGSIRVMLIAVDKNSYGSTFKDIKLSAPVVMLPTIPRSLKINDNFSLPIEVIPIEDVKNAKITIKSDGIIDFNQNISDLVFSSKTPKTIFFEGKVREELGIENIDITLESGGFKMQDITQIDIKSPNPYISISTNYMLNANNELEISAPSDFVKNSNKGKITISTNPLLSLEHRIMWLMRYPYGCIEQTTSSVFPQLFIDKLSNVDFIDKQTIIDNINAGIARISSFQTADGGFSYWQGSGNSDKWGSAYAGHFLIMAKKNGYYVSEELLKRWEKYMINDAINGRNDVYPLYLLALNGNPQLGSMNTIYENDLKSLSITNRWLLAASYKLAGFDDIASKITNGLSIEPDETSSYYDYSYGSRLRNEAIILQAYKIVKNQINESLYNNIKDKLETNNWLSTQTTSYALLVLADIKEDSKNAKMDGKITINGKTQNFNSNKDKLNFDLNSGMATISSKNNLFINYIWEGISTDNKGDNIASNMRLYRNFVQIDEYGNERSIDVRELKSSESFYIKLVLEGIDSSYIDMKNIALTQNLPSGWEIENTRLNNDYVPEVVNIANSKITYIDIRDDKIMWFFDLYDKRRVVYVKVNAVTPGTYTLPPAYAEAMYNGSYRASTDSFRVRVNAK